MHRGMEEPRTYKYVRVILRRSDVENAKQASELFLELLQELEESQDSDVERLREEQE